MEEKIAHLQIVQGVIDRMASDARSLRSLTITIVAAFVAIAQIGNELTPYLAILGVVPILIFWRLTAYYLHVERAYRHLYDLIRKDEQVDSFAMDWRRYKNLVDSPAKISWSKSVFYPYFAMFVTLVGVAVLGWFFDGCIQ